MKKGQITMFVVLGLVLLILIGLVLMMTSSLRKGPDVEAELEFSDEESKIKLHVDSCLQKIGEEGVRKLGDQGGYIDPQKFGFFAIEGIPTSSNALEFSPGSPYVIPYWHYMKSSNSCSSCFFNNGKPPIEKKERSRSVERQLEDFIDNNLEKCVDLTQFKDFDAEATGEVSTSVTVGESSVIISASYPITIIGDTGASQKITEYQSSLGLNLIKFFDLADEIMFLVKQKGFFEKLTTELITINSLGDQPGIPPISGGTSIDANKIPSWKESDVLETLKVSLADNIGNVQIMGSRDSLIYTDDDPYFESFYMNMVFALDYDPEVLADINIDFLYLPWWEPYLKVKPNRGGLIMEKPKSFGLPGVIDIMMLTNNFFYDLSYPVVVLLEDTESFNGAGFSFKFAFEVNLRSNKPFEFSLDEEEDLDDEEEELFDRTASFFANPLNWNSGEIRINTVDPNDQSSVEDVSITFTCGADSIYLENSFKDETGIANVKSKLPVCYGGIVSGFKQGYFVKSARIDTLLDESQDVTLSVQSKKKVNLFFKKKMVAKMLEGTKLEWQYIPASERDVAFDEKVTAIFTRQTAPMEDEFISYLTFYGNQTDIPQIELVAGNYTVEAYLMKGGVVIPEEEICPDNSDCVTIEETDFGDSFLAGGITMDNITLPYLDITFVDLQKENLILHLIAFEASDFTVHEDLTQLDKRDEYINESIDDFVPVFE